jgi:cystathionine gamma-synthase
MTSYLSRSITDKTLAAVEQDTACSLDRPPNTMATLGLLDPIIGSEPICSTMAHVGAHDDSARPTQRDDAPAVPRPDPDNARLSPTTIAVQAGRPAALPDAPFNPPLVMASTYVAGGDLEYGRYGNPTWEAFEEALGALEGGRALSFASGMATVAAVLDLVALGETVVAARHCYLGTLTHLANLEQRGLLNVVLVDIDDTDQVLAALTDEVALLWVESPTNPALEVADLPRLSAGARDAGVTVVVDNTFATPMLQRPLDLGADLVVHSATKYISGHSDAVIGAVVTRDQQVFTALDEKRRTAGALPGTLEAWLALRGMRTLPLRVERAQANAQELVRRLAGHAAVSRVRYPGFGGIVAIEVAGGAAAADLVTHAARLWVNATSLGGVHSSFERRRRWQGESRTIDESLIRLSVGIEDVEDLWADLAQALDASQR